MSVNIWKIPQTDLAVSRIAYGCANLAAWNQEAIGADDAANAARLIHTARDNGITLFDHADLYAFGKAEVLFGQILSQSPGLRNQIVIQSKCGQQLPQGWKPGSPIAIDLSREHISSEISPP